MHHLQPFRRTFAHHSRTATQHLRRRFLSTEPRPSPPKPNTSSQPPHATTSSSSTHARLTRLFSSRLLPTIVKTRLLFPLLNAPLSTITSFLILHELTAGIPLLTLAGVFHYTQWLPPYFSEGAWVVKGVEKFGRYFRRKGWISDGEERRVEREARKGEVRKEEKVNTAEEKKGWKDRLGLGRLGKDGRTRKEKAERWWGVGETGTRVVVEVATAYAIVKVLFPLRLAVSAWWAEGFARRVVMPAGRSFGRLFGPKGEKVVGNGSGVAGTGAVGGAGLSPSKGVGKGKES